MQAFVIWAGCCLRQTIPLQTERGLQGSHNKSAGMPCARTGHASGPCAADVTLVRYTCMQARPDGVLSFKKAKHEEQTVGTVTDISQGVLTCVRSPEVFHICEILSCMTVHQQGTLGVWHQVATGIVLHVGRLTAPPAASTLTW